jgi:hypothetical protein
LHQVEARDAPERPRGFDLLWSRRNAEFTIATLAARAKALEL